MNFSKNIFLGVLYDGKFNPRGEFHGPGILIYPNGQQIQGMWENGKLGRKVKFVFSSGDILNEHYQYCMYPDRRYELKL